MTIDEIRAGTFLLFDKPFRWTSFDVVNKIKRSLHVKCGHAGTLDPFATGLLIVCTASATKKISTFQTLEKEYTGSFELGATTPSHDLETTIDQRFDLSTISDENILNASKKFIGTIEQLAPIHSAKQHEGKRYYEYARKGKEFERKPQSVTLHDFEITRIALPEIDFRLVCSKGFYVRSLAHDFGLALNNGAYLKVLRRTRIGTYDVKDAHQVNDFVNFVRQEQSNAGLPQH